MLAPTLPEVIARLTRTTAWEPEEDDATVLLSLSSTIPLPLGRNDLSVSNSAAQDRHRTWNTARRHYSERDTNIRTRHTREVTRLSGSSGCWMDALHSHLPFLLAGCSILDGLDEAYHFLSSGIECLVTKVKEVPRQRQELRQGG